jgi:hypothetical protein
VETLFRGKNAVLVPTFRKVYALLVRRLKCEAHVATIYVGFSRQGHMVAAAYPRQGEHFELALALPRDFQSPLLYDAPHLKWPTMRVAVAIRDDASLAAAEPLIRQAAEEVSTATRATVARKGRLRS